jgi:imidazolonepropionase-like amidohydrolase
MDGGPRTLPDQTVLVRDGRVAWMGPAAQARLPEGVTRVDGRGRFLMPGLAKMHAHVPPQQNVTEEQLRDLMFLYVANGVTTIRGMLGAPYQLALRDRLARGELLGPQFLVAAPSLNGNSAPDPATARRLVAEHKAAGYDLVKLHPGLSRATYDAAVEAARASGITLGGHVSAGVGLARTLEARQGSIDHLDGYVEALIPDSLRERAMAGELPLGRAIASISGTESELRALAQRTKTAGVWNVPTAFLWESFFGPVTAEAAAARPEMRYVSPLMVRGWTTQKRDRAAADAEQEMTPALSARYLQLRRRVLKALADEGAPLLMGTDSPQMFNVPGFALHREVALMAEAGVPAYTVLESGTRNVARYAREVLGKPDDFGTVAVGKRADLVLLDADPLADVRHLARRAGVMVRGRWLPAEELERGLAAIAAKHAAGR